MSTDSSGLKARLMEIMPAKQAALKAMKKDHGHKIVDKVTIDQLIGGARSIKSMLWETSLLDPVEGIRFRGYTIPELQEKLPSYAGPADAGEPMPEALLWLLLCDEIPTKAQADALSAELHARAKLPDHVEPMIRAFPKGMHPMTQLSSAILAMQTDSVFAREYAKGTSKALAASYVHKADFADNKHARAITHHGYGGFGGGAHFTMSGSRSFHKGVRLKGLVQRKVTAAKTRQGNARHAKAEGRGGKS